MLVQHPLLRHRVKARVPRSTFIRGREAQVLLCPAAPVELAARQGGLCAPLDVGRNTGKATLNLWCRILVELTGLELPASS
jgi:hypothetical protein